MQTITAKFILLLLIFTPPVRNEDSLSYETPTMRKLTETRTIIFRREPTAKSCETNKRFTHDNTQCD